MKRILLTLLAVVIVLWLFAAFGYTGYRFGYAQGVQTTANGDGLRPGLRFFDDVGPRGMRGHDFEFGRGFSRGFGGFPMMRFGFLPWLGVLVVLTLLALFIYWLFTRTGWRFTRAAPVTETAPQSVETEVKE